jgi:CelD/BcsL family acetyltransferase involved in cellulose biosynthesis
MTAISVTRLDSLVGLEPEWSELVNRTATATPFQRPEWLIPWWEHFGGGELHALAFRSEGRLCGLFGMFVHEWLGRRQATLVGTGLSDYLDLIVEPAVAAECARRTFDYLRDLGGCWEICNWQDLPPESPLIASVPCDFAHRVDQALPCSRIALPSSPDAWSETLPHGLQRTIRIAARRLERQGGLCFSTLTEDPGGNTLRGLLRLHESRWAAKGGTGSMLDRPEAQSFFVDAACRFGGSGRLRLYTMNWRGEPAAVVCALFDRGRAWGYITGMDPELSRFSPGSLLLDYAVRQAIGEGASHWEFLRGDEPYKFQWGARAVPKARLILWPGSVIPHET